MILLKYATVSTFLKFNVRRMQESSYPIRQIYNINLEISMLQVAPEKKTVGETNSLPWKIIQQQ